jgi:UDP-N-acetyl-2-amino-2-deoxyglucuronate dehydrogenase
MKNFGIIGAAGYIAPRHMKAIKDTNNKLIACYDPFDSVGVLDSLHPDCDFFKEFERFDRHLNKIKKTPNKIDIISICSPNYLHDSHIRYGLRSECDVICEKPIVLNPWNIDALLEIEKETGKKVYGILQLRYHQTIIELRKKIQNINPKNDSIDVELEYITSRGNWYQHSWKGDISKSGGVVTNIGVHFFDMLIWVFGECEDIYVEELTPFKASGVLKLKSANIKWKLSIDKNDLPPSAIINNKTTHRALKMDGVEIEFSDGFTDLHTISYSEILKGNGYGLKDCKAAIELVSKIRNFK